MTWQALNLAAEQFGQPAEPPSTACLIYRGKRHVVSGPPESAKSLFALIVALEEMRTGGIVAVIDFEQGPTGVRRMLDDLGATLEEIGSILYFEPEGPPDSEDIDRIVDAQVTLAVLDAAAGAYDVSDLDDNKRIDAERFAAAWIKPLWVNGIATVVIDHVPKNAESRGKFSIGSERKIGTADVHLGLEAVTALSRGAVGLVKIATHKDRPGFLPRPTAAELELRSDPDTHRITWTFRAAARAGAADVWRPTVLMKRIEDYLGEQSEPVNRSTVVDAIKGKRDWVLKAIDILVADGGVSETAGPRNAKLLTLTSRSQFPAVPGTFRELPVRESVPGSHSLQGNGSKGTAQTTLEETP